MNIRSHNMEMALIIILLLELLGRSKAYTGIDATLILVAQIVWGVIFTVRAYTCIRSR